MWKHYFYLILIFILCNSCSFQQKNSPSIKDPIRDFLLQLESENFDLKTKVFEQENEFKYVANFLKISAKDSDQTDSLLILVQVHNYSKSNDLKTKFIDVRFLQTGAYILFGLELNVWLEYFYQLYGSKVQLYSSRYLSEEFSLAPGSHQWRWIVVKLPPWQDQVQKSKFVQLILKNSKDLMKFTSRE